jgi:Pyridine nucleotide-disulphide oxidoreductase/Cyclic nucleotide-binding domain
VIAKLFDLAPRDRGFCNEAGRSDGAVKTRKVHSFKAQACCRAFMPMTNSDPESAPGPEKPVPRRDPQFDAAEFSQPAPLLGGDEIPPAGILIEQHRPQMFPRLSAARIDQARRFGTHEYWRAGDVMFRAGEASLGIRILLQGTVLLTRSDGLGHSHTWAELSDGQFLGETAQLMGKPHLVNGHATTDVEALLISPERIRALLVEHAQLGEQIMRALILRRAGLVQEGSGPLLIGSPADSNLISLEGFFRRVNHPYRVVNAASDAETLAFLEKLPDWSKTTPIVFLSTYASRIHVLIRKSDLQQSMSQYLIDRIKALHNVVVHSNSAIESVASDKEGLSSITFRSPQGVQAIETRFLFLFTGADPNTYWLQGCGVEVDEKGFVRTGHTGGPDSVSRRFALQTSIPGVFAAGDVRSSSVKRVSAAVGEGAVVAEVHAFLSHVA